MINNLVCLLAVTQIRAFYGVTTKRQSPGSLMSHAKNNRLVTPKSIWPNQMQTNDMLSVRIQATKPGETADTKTPQLLHLSNGWSG